MLGVIFEAFSKPLWLAFALIIIILFSWLRALQSTFRVKTLGARYAPKIPTYLPFSLEFIYKSITAARKQRSFDLWHLLFSTYGTVDSPYTVEVNVGSRRFILTADHEIIKAVLATQFSNFGKGETFNRQFHDFLGDSVFTTDGKEWHDSRQLIRPLFVNQRIGDLEIFERHAQKLLSLISGKGEITELQQLFYRYTLDVATDFMFGTTVGSLDNPQVKFANAISEVQSVQAILARSGPLYPFIPRKTYLKGLVIINSLIKPFVSRTLDLSPDELEKVSNTSSKEYTLLHALARSTRNPKKIRDELVNLLFAGRDTTAATLSWLFYELAGHPSVVRKLRSEIISVLGDDCNKAPKPEDLKKMKYLHHTVDETLRLYPPVPFNIRSALSDTMIATPNSPRPLYIQKGDSVAFSTLVLHRRADLHPPPSQSFAPVDQFSPERWDAWTPRPWTYIPFNGGPRICIGQQFALREIWFTVCRILQRFERLERVEIPSPGDGGGRDERVQFMKTEIVGTPGRKVRVRFWESDGACHE
ncbi:cytochrome P450 [Glonium stellatum]|uniref:Cytochrome P450 n=1 Tax=Glonium stellatum TaxID=574774 RepID=A0A8E2F2S5_9PEZI|nr:cytochrome P450 [Glonium stellatum]